MKRLSKARIPLEKEIQKTILDYLRLKGYFCWKNNTAGIFDQRSKSYIPSHNVGAPDIFVIVPPLGRCIAIEVKRPGNYQSQEQKEWQKRHEKSGGIYWLVYSIDELIQLEKSCQS